MKLEGGKYYLNRREGVIGPMCPSGSKTNSFLDPSGYVYACDGSVLLNRESPADLVKEYIKPVSQSDLLQNILEEIKGLREDLDALGRTLERRSR